MTTPPRRTATRNTRVIDAPAESLFDAFVDPDALVAWLPPVEMTGRMHAFRAGVGAALSLEQLARRFA